LPRGFAQGHNQARKRNGPVPSSNTIEEQKIVQNPSQNFLKEHLTSSNGSNQIYQAKAPIYFPGTR
jgi:hypothetical protein